MNLSWLCAFWHFSVSSQAVYNAWVANFVSSSVSDNLLLKYVNTEVTHTGHHVYPREIIFLVIVNGIFVAGTTITLTSPQQCVIGNEKHYCKSNNGSTIIAQTFFSVYVCVALCP